MVRSFLLVQLAVQHQTVLAGTIPAAPGFFSGACVSWVDVLASNHLARSSGVTPNGAPCCSPVTEADLSIPCPAARAVWPCPACVTKCTPGTGAKEVFVLGTPKTLEACKALGAAFGSDGLSCVSVSWVHPVLNNEVWENKCFCGTSTLSWATDESAVQEGVDSAYCVAYDSAWGWPFLIVAIGAAALYVGVGVGQVSRGQGGRAQMA